MALCPHCGSGTRDKDGFCGGCGAPWPLPVRAAPAPLAAPSPLMQLTGLESVARAMEVRRKHVGIAVLSALLFGPLGLAYASRLGAALLSLLAVVLSVSCGRWAILLLHPLCAFWAWWATRE